MLRPVAPSSIYIPRHFRVNRPSCTANKISKMASYLKKSTGMVGLAVSKAPRESLIALYDKTLGVLKEMPPEASYRKHTEKITNQRLNLVTEESDISILEKKIGAGQVEEVIKQAEDELALAKKMLVWKAWEPLHTAPPEGQWEWP